MDLRTLDEGKTYLLIGFVEMGTNKIISDFNVLGQTPVHDLLRPSRIKALVKLRHIRLEP